eukprot:TRINITY_DN76340_c0_g1_i1.p1 TRINITY_DN76340_c0_g1~~TRINITY_DN76340_c0_g1_i1.p1  ORF type:complete len:472 (-),score=99.00 TRINITY_DN76340_c0_g1_i1:62-1477(-)
MLDIYSIVAGVCLILCATLGYLTRPKSDVSLPDGFRGFQLRFLAAWILCVGGEWMKGPGVYALYASFGLSKEEIASIFVYGFVAAFLMGSFVGAVADSFGRKRSVLLFCFINVISCACKHSDNYYVLRGARMLDGMVSSLLFIVFESWLVYEHVERSKFPIALLGTNFSMMYFVSYLTAILCGLMAQAGQEAVPATMAAGLHLGGWTVPFDIAAMLVTLGGLFVLRHWGENYGKQASSSAVDGLATMGQGIRILFTDVRALLCCFVAATFEGSMFIFIVLWTPTLSVGGTKPPCGIAFATYMMACMSGAGVFQFLHSCRANVVLLFTCLLASAAMAVPAIGGVSEEMVGPNFVAFVMFEFCVGLYFPASGKMKSEFIPESHRATIYGCFRAPISAVVLTVLMQGAPLLFSLRLVSLLLASSGFLLGCFWLHTSLNTRQVHLREDDIISNDKLKSLLSVEKEGETSNGCTVV